MKIRSVILKSIPLFTIVIFSCVVQGSSQDIDQIAVDGLILSYYLGENDFESIESYLKKHDYQFVPDEPNGNPNLQAYYKHLNVDEGEGLTLIIDTRRSEKGENQYRIGISHVNASKGSFFLQKLMKRFEDHALFKKFEDVYVFSIPKAEEEMPKEPESYLEMMNYSSMIQVGDMAMFYPPSTANKYFDWAYYIPKYVAAD